MDKKEEKIPFFDINKFPAKEGLVVFPISMSRISNSQSGDIYFNYIEEFTKKIARPVIGVTFIYTDNLYSKYHQDTTASIHKYLDLMITHKNLFLKTLIQKSKYVEKAFSFMTWTQLCIEVKNYLQMLSKVRKFYDEDENFRKYIKDDIEYSKRKVSEDNINFVLEETLMSYLILKDEVYLQNEFVMGREKWRLMCYPGKPNKAFVYFFQKDILKLQSTNIYQNHYYVLDEKKLYDFTKINLDNF